MKKVLNLIKAVLTIGRDPQSFIGAKWVVLLLRTAPRFLRRGLALRILSLSPHYFYREHRPEYRAMSHRDFLEAEHDRNRSSRQMICDLILLRYLNPGDQILDVGCGPGFLAYAASRHVRQVYACDISLGVLECARILNASDSIAYLYSGDSGFAHIEHSSLDLVYSFAVIQHVREATIRYLWEVAWKKLRPGGYALFQVQLEGDPRWDRENQWEQNRSVTGYLRLKFALNFFPRTETFFRELATETGFSVVAVHLISDLCSKPFDDICYQHLVVLTKPR